ncbi:hypothetical protein BDV24DRAFT_142577 [Aspergillus arachidicola]|uniref:Uncharacterized protein n=1 Tax=Aspergillus arachidicola TaxID=656916 RepID=A0A5N6XSK5_9EURO|nr:hypothetical protein BDV24DRAFT_142577 [Aspergillus arachidicola]
MDSLLKEYDEPAFFAYSYLTNLWTAIMIGCRHILAQQYAETLHHETVHCRDLDNSCLAEKQFKANLTLISMNPD